MATVDDVGVLEWDRRSLALRRLSFAVVYAVAYLGSAILVKEFSPVGGFSPWYPPAGVMFGTLVAIGPRWMPWAVAVRIATIAIVSPSIFDDQPGAVVARAVVIVGAYGGAAMILRRVRLVRVHPREFVLFTSIGVFGAPFVATLGLAAIDAIVDDIAFVDGVIDARVFWIGDALAIAAIVPFVLLATRWATVGRPRLSQSVSTYDRVESSIQAGLLVAIPLVAMASEDGQQLPVVLLLIVLPLLWVALRHDVVIAAAGMLVSVAVASFALRAALDDGDLIRMQVVLLTSTVAAMFAAAVRRRHEDVVAELGEHEQELSRVNAQLERSLAHITASTIERGVVFSAVAHDAKAPLAAIVLRAQMLARADPSADVDLRVTLLAAIEDDARSVMELLDGAARQPETAEAASMIERAEVNVGDVCFREVTRFRHGTHTIGLDMPRDEVLVWADRLQVERMLGNLVSNARDHTPAGTHIAVSVTAVGDRVVAAVDDDGPGFEGGIAPVGAVGLHLVDRFAEFNGAEVRYGTSSRGGARVEVDFPIIKSGEPPVTPASSGRSPVAAGGQAAGRPNGG